MKMISVEKKLPEITEGPFSKKLLIALYHGKSAKYEFYIGCYFKGENGPRWWLRDEGFVDDDEEQVTHWLELDSPEV